MTDSEIMRGRVKSASGGMYTTVSDYRFISALTCTFRLMAAYPEDSLYLTKPAFIAADCRVGSTITSLSWSALLFSGCFVSKGNYSSAYYVGYI